MSLSLPTLRSWRSTIYAPSSRDILNKAVESEHSINHRLSQQPQYQNSVTEFRRRLARKASTFSLRGKNRRSQKHLKDLVKQEEPSDTASVETVRQEDLRGSNIPPSSIGIAVALPAPSPNSPASNTLPILEANRLNKTAPQPRREHTCASMSSESSAPPVPIKRLEEIATEVCFRLTVFRQCLLTLVRHAT